jgi:hypothetical protein
MINYLDPSAPLINEFLGVDKAIQNIQEQLQNDLGWLGNHAFGRAFKQELVKILPGQSSRKLIYYPEVYQAGGEPLNVMPNDNLRAQSFFYVNDPIKAIDYLPGHNSIFTAPASLVVWINLKKLNVIATARTTEQLKLQVLVTLGKFSNVYVTKTFESYENVFSNYTILEEYREYMKFPYTAFRIDFDLSYRILVGDPNICYSPLKS